MDTLKYMLWIEPTRWGELFLGSLKIMAGITLLWYLWEPPATSAALSVNQASLIGLMLLVLGLAQWTVVWGDWRWPRFIVSCVATGGWIILIGATWIATGTARPILIYIPFLLFNVLVALRVAPTRKQAKVE